jgi:hypothetical protein
MSAGVGLRRRRRGYARQGYGRGAPLRPAVFAPPQRRRLRQQVSGGTGTLNMFARPGFVARGIAYVVIGVIRVMIAFGIARYEPDRAGAIEAIAARPFGYLLLWILVIGFPREWPCGGLSRPRCGG